MKVTKYKLIGGVVAVGALVFLLTGNIPYFLSSFNKNSQIPSMVDDRQNNNDVIMGKFSLQSPAFPDGQFIGSKYTCDEINISPPLVIFNVPQDAKSLVLIMDDPDVPKQLRPDGVFDHWTVYNIDPKTSFIDEGQIFGTVGQNGRGESKYTGPCPPPQYQPTTHRYVFRLFALDISTLNFIKAPTKQEILTAIESHIIDQATLVGLYDRTKTVKEND